MPQLHLRLSARIARDRKSFRAFYGNKKETQEIRRDRAAIRHLLFYVPPLPSASAKREKRMTLARDMYATREYEEISGA